MPGVEIAKLRALFDEALELSGPDRQAFLAGACDGDTTLQGQVEELLCAAEREDDFLSSPTEGVPDDLRGGTPAIREAAGARIGPYTLLELIGEGGFGSVFMAEQAEPVVRRVALKIIKLGMDTRQVIARFEAERQALALMDHPNIARVLDAGATESGRPYFVMELVKGEPITGYCEHHSVGVRERLQLFVQVCNAVQHAHQKGIIHRDIKPSNVLVTMFDGKPVPKVIDFGIAKATNAKLTGKVFTEVRQLVGTPEYMSPEQAEASGVDIDTRSDIYSLGVLLYELLTGTTPFEARRLRSAAYGEVQRIIREEDPPRPSTRLSAMNQKPASISAKRHAERARLARQVRGELDWIVMKCLEKDRTRRYETASALAADVLRHLSAEPVVAAPPSRAYRVRKLMLRHRGAVGASSVMVALMAAGSVVSTRLWRVAEDKATQAEVIASFMEDTLDGVDPLHRAGLDTQLLKRMMNEAARRIKGGELSDAPEAEARLRLSIGRVYRRIAEFEAAHGMLDPLDRALPADGDEQMGEVVFEVALLAAHEGNMAAALSGCRNAQAVFERIHDSRRVAEAQEIIVECLRKLGRYEEALAAAREGLEMHRRLAPPDPEGALDHELNLAQVLLDLDRQTEALPLFEAVLPRLRQRGDHPYVGWALDSVGTCLLELGRPEEAVPALREAGEVMRRFHGAPHQQEVRPRLIEALRRSGRLGEAEGYAREVLRLFDEHPAWDDRVRREAQWFLARTLDDAGRAGEAIESLRRFVEYGRGQARAASKSASLLMLAWMLLRHGAEHAVEAEVAVRECLAIPWDSEFNVPGFSWQRDHARSMLGEALALQSRFEEAEPLLLEGYHGLMNAPAVPSAATYDQDFKGDALRRITRFYEAWETAQPDRGHGAEGARWREEHTKASASPRAPPGGSPSARPGFMN